MQRVLREGPECIGELAAGVHFWADVWDAVHLEEIYVEIAAPSALRVAPSADVHLDELVDGLPEWTRVHMSTVAAESFAQTLQLLHYEGILVAQDLFAGDVGQYASFRGPGKLEGSIVNWINAPIFQLIGERSGFEVTVEPFAYREGSNISVLSARHRDAYRRPSGDTTTTSLRRRRAMLASALSSRSFVVTAEFGPPRDPDPDIVRAGARALAASVDAVNVTDNQAATVKLSPVACSALLIDEGVDPILQLTARDRNVMALQAELLGAWALGVRTVLALSGDPLSVGPYEGMATRVGDLDSLGLTRLIATMNGGRLAADEPLAFPTSFLIAGAANPLVDSVERIAGKLDAGVGLLQTNIVYDVDRFAAWLAPFVEAGITERAPLLVGVAPPRSTRMLTHMHERIPGVEVDDATFAAWRASAATPRPPPASRSPPS